MYKPRKLIDQKLNQYIKTAVLDHESTIVPIVGIKGTDDMGSIFQFNFDAVMAFFNWISRRDRV